LTRNDLDSIFAAHRLERRLIPADESAPPPGIGERRAVAEGAFVIAPVEDEGESVV